MQLRLLAFGALGHHFCTLGFPLFLIAAITEHPGSTELSEGCFNEWQEIRPLVQCSVRGLHEACEIPSDRFSRAGGKVGIQRGEEPPAIEINWPFEVLGKLLAYVRTPANGYLSLPIPISEGRGNEFTVVTR